MSTQRVILRRLFLAFFSVAIVKKTQGYGIDFTHYAPGIKSVAELLHNHLPWATRMVE